MITIKLCHTTSNKTCQLVLNIKSLFPVRLSFRNRSKEGEAVIFSKMGAIEEGLDLKNNTTTSIKGASAPLNETLPVQKTLNN